MYYCNYFRSNDTEKTKGLDNNNLNEIESSNLSCYCPYCQFYRQTSPFEYMSRQQNPGAPSGQPPSGGPPSFTPSKAPGQMTGAPGLMAVDPGSIRRCLHRFVYIWPRRGRGFWAWLTYVGRRSVAGYRWNGRRWIYFGMGLNNIDSFTCH